VESWVQLEDLCNAHMMNCASLHLHDIPSFFLSSFAVEVSCVLRPSEPALGGAGRSGRLPLFHIRCKLVVRHRNGVPAFIRIPAPRHQFVFFEVLDELIEITVLILLLVLILASDRSSALVSRKTEYVPMMVRSDNPAPKDEPSLIERKICASVRPCQIMGVVGGG